MPREYHTKQSDRITACLRDRADCHLTAAQVTELLRAAGDAVGSATVYRRLERLVAEGSVRKFVTGTATPACYQYAGDAPCGAHYHLRCTVCGRLIHLDCEVLREIAAHIRDHHQFEIDPTKTVFYGKCAACAGNEEEHEAAKL